MSLFSAFQEASNVKFSSPDQGPGLFQEANNVHFSAFQEASNVKFSSSDQGQGLFQEASNGNLSSLWSVPQGCSLKGVFNIEGRPFDPCRTSPGYYPHAWLGAKTPYLVYIHLRPPEPRTRPICTERKSAGRGTTSPAESKHGAPIRGPSANPDECFNCSQ